MIFAQKCHIERERYVIYENFSGYVHVIFDSQNGQEVKYQKKIRVYEIPESGVLITKFKPNTGWCQQSNIEFITKGQNGQYLKLNWIPQSTINNKVYFNENIRNDHAAKEKMVMGFSVAASNYKIVVYENNYIKLPVNTFLVEEFNRVDSILKPDTIRLNKKIR